MKLQSTQPLLNGIIKWSELYHNLSLRHIPGVTRSFTIGGKEFMVLTDEQLITVNLTMLRNDPVVTLRRCIATKHPPVPHHHAERMVLVKQGDVLVHERSESTMCILTESAEQKALKNCGSGFATGA